MVGDLADIKYQAFGEELVEEVIEQADRSGFFMYIPD